MDGEAISAASRQANNFSEDDEANDKRWWRAVSRRHLSKIKRSFFWFLFALICVGITVAAAGYLYLVNLWLGTILYGTKVHDPKALKDFIDGVLWSILVVFATLFVQSMFKDRE